MPGWLPTIVEFFNYGILSFVVVMQIQMLVIAYFSWRELEDEDFRTKHGRVQICSHLTRRRPSRSSSPRTTRRRASPSQSVRWRCCITRRWRSSS